MKDISPQMVTVTTPTWKTIDGKLYHLEPSINRTYKHGGRSYNQYRQGRSRHY